MRPAPHPRQVVAKEDDYTLYESLGRYVAATVQPHLILMASNNLCETTSKAAARIGKG